MLPPWLLFDFYISTHRILAKYCDFAEILRGLRQYFCLFAFCIGQKRPFPCLVLLSHCTKLPQCPFLRITRDFRTDSRLLAAALNAVTQPYFGCCISAQFQRPFSELSIERAFLAFKHHSAAVHVNPDWSMVWCHPVSRHMLIMSQSLSDMAA